MSLTRQLMWIIFVTFFLVFIGTLAISVENMREYLIKQLSSHSQDAATSLGLSLQPSIAEGDEATVNAMVNAMFDRGDYQEISVRTPEGILAERKLEGGVSGVPEWFQILIPLDTPTGEAIVTAGWKQAARVYVKSNSAYAYADLWNNAIQTFKWFAVALATVMAFVLILLRFVMAPLKEVEKQALAISERQFPVQEKLPYTRELRSVVQSMNKMSKKVERIVTEQADLAETMRDEAYSDPLTGLDNRRNFDMQLEHMVTAKDEVAFGALFLIRVADFAEYNKKHGHEKADDLIKDVARFLQGQVKGFPNTFLSRLHGAEFAVLAQNTTVEDAKKLGERLGLGLGKLEFEGMERGVGHIGIGYYSVDVTGSELLAGADTALRQAQQKGPNQWALLEKGEIGEANIHGAEHWTRIIENVIEKKRLSFLFQPAKTALSGGVGDVLHYEALARIKVEDGSPVPAAVFMPMVERINLSTQFDKTLVEMGMELISDSPDSDAVYSLNLFSASVYDEKFRGWLVDTLKSAGPKVASRIMFEISEYVALVDLDSFQSLIKSVSDVGSRCILDNFGSSSKSFGYLRGLHLEFIKLDGSYVKNLSINKDNQLFIRAISDVAHGLDIDVIAKSVESEEDLQILHSLRVDGAQGYYVGEPKEDLNGR